MIVVSLLLILVAVTLLVLGLTGGSSALLIASIAASLLAAIALVVGARSAASARRAAGARTEPSVSLSDPAFDVESDFSTSERSSAPPSEYGPPARSEYAAEPAPSGYPERSSEPYRQNDPGAMMDDPPAPDEGLASTGSMRARAASPEDAEAALRADAAYRADADSPVAEPLASPNEADAEASGYNDAVLTDENAYERERAARAGGGDYDEAASYIGGARTATPGADAWRRGPAGSPEASRDAAAAGLDDPAGEFDEPDADDPDDEPLPQAVRPADAVRVAQLDDEVLVVDGRPRYHMADCAHLVGKLTEGLPISEAVELGFSPCGLCRPVDRLVAKAAHR